MRYATPATAAVRWAPVLLAAILLPMLADRSCDGQDEPPETILSRLQFRIVEPAPSRAPITSFTYGVNIYSGDAENPDRKRGVAYRADDGVLRIPEPFPAAGRIQVWIECDDQRGFRYGYGDYSYKLDDSKIGEIPTIELWTGAVLAGKVVDAESGQPIADAEAAPLVRNHHLLADWSNSTRTDKEGNFRLTSRRAEGLIVRHPNYRLFKTKSPGRSEVGEGGPMSGNLFKLQPLRSLRGRVVDGEGNPISDVSVIQDTTNERSDAEGRFKVRFTGEEWERRTEHRVSFHADGFHMRLLTLSEFDKDNETTIALTAEPRIRGQVLDAAGKPVKACSVDLLGHTSICPDFETLPGPDENGNWEASIRDDYYKFTLRISIDGAIRSEQHFSREEAMRGPIVTRLSVGRRLTGKFVGRAPLDARDLPVVMLLSAASGDESGEPVPVRKSGEFSVEGLADGDYTLQLAPRFYASARSAKAEHGLRVIHLLGANWPQPNWRKKFTVADRDIELPPIDVHKEGLLGNRVNGVAFDSSAAKRPLANHFGYVCTGEDDIGLHGQREYLIVFMTDSEGRFQIDACPPGKYLLRFSARSSGFGYDDPAAWIRVAPDKPLDLRLFPRELKLVPSKKHPLSWRVEDSVGSAIASAAAQETDSENRIGSTPRGVALAAAILLTGLLALGYAFYRKLSLRFRAKVHAM